MFIALIFTTNTSGKEDQSSFKYPEYIAGQAVSQDIGNFLKKWHKGIMNCLGWILQIDSTEQSGRKISEHFPFGNAKIF